MSLTRLGIKGAISKNSVFASKDGSWLTTFLLNKKIVYLKKNNVSQHKIAENLGLSPSTVNNIVKRFRKSEEMCIKAKYENHCSMTVTLELLCGITLETVMLHSHMGLGVLITAKNCILQRESHTSVLCKNIGEFSGPKLIWNRPKNNGNVFCGQMSPRFSLF